MADKIAYHPNGVSVITFLEGPHTYMDNNGMRYLSGTSLVKKFWISFDAVSMADKCSKGRNPKYQGRTAEEILEEWEAERLRGSSEGDNTHLYAEAVSAGWPMADRPAPISERTTLLFAQVDLVHDFLTRVRGFVFVSAEMVVFDPALGLAGMIDLIMYEPSTETLWILDWKQNKEIKTQNPWQMGKGPLSHLQQTDLNIYTLQLSTYQYLIEKNRYFPHSHKIRRALIHIKPHEYEIIPLNYWNYEVEEMFRASKEINFE